MRFVNCINFSCRFIHRLFRSRVFIIGLSVVLGSNIFVGCRNPYHVDVITLETEELLNEGDETSYPFSYTDFYGNTTVVDKEPQKVVSISPMVTEIMGELNALDKLVGRTDFCNYPSEVMNVESVGNINSPSIEKIVQLNPDLIVSSSIFEEDYYNQLINLGYRVVIIQNENTLDGGIENITDIGRLLNKNAEAQEISNTIKSKLDKIKEKIAQNNAFDNASEFTVYYCMGFGDNDYAPGKDTFINELIEAAGATNIAANNEGWNYSKEELIINDPDVILIPENYKDEFVKTTPYNELSATLNGRVIGVNEDIFERQTGRNIEAVEIIYEAGRFAKDSN